MHAAAVGLPGEDGAVVTDARNPDLPRQHRGLAFEPGQNQVHCPTAHFVIGLHFGFLITACQPDLLITVDNGISSLDGVEAASASGVQTRRYGREARRREETEGGKDGRIV